MANNLFEDIPSQLADELTEVLVESRCVRIERIVSESHASAENFWYDQDDHEWVLLLQGSASIEFDLGHIESLLPGDYLLIPAHKKHRVYSTSEQEQSIWLAIFIAI